MHPPALWFPALRLALRCSPDRSVAEHDQTASARVKRCRASDKVARASRLRVSEDVPPRNPCRLGGGTPPKHAGGTPTLRHYYWPSQTVLVLLFGLDSGLAECILTPCIRHMRRGNVNPASLRT